MIGISDPDLHLSRCMDARAERAISSAHGARGDSSSTWSTSPVRSRRRRSAGSFDVTALADLGYAHSAQAVLGLPLHEGLRPGRRRIIPPFGRSLLEFPWPRLYEHPWMNCALAIERTYQGEEGVFVGLFRAPEQQTLIQLQQAVPWYKHQPLEKVGFYRMALRFSHARRLIRRLLWWSTLNVSGYKRCKRFGTFGLSSYGLAGCRADPPDLAADDDADIRPDRPSTGRVVVKLIYDHRVLDGAYIARRLRDIEDAMNGPILAELLDDRTSVTRSVSAEPRSTSSRSLKPHLPLGAAMVEVDA